MLRLPQPDPMAEQAGTEPAAAAHQPAADEPAADEPAADDEFARPNRRLLVAPWQQVARNIDMLYWHAVSHGDLGTVQCSTCRKPDSLFNCFREVSFGQHDQNALFIDHFVNKFDSNGYVLQAGSIVRPGASMKLPDLAKV